MVRPVCFGWNSETAGTNHFQTEMSFPQEEIHHRAVLEFDRTTALLRQHGIKVTVVDDVLENRTPDSIFPNNWFSTHPNGGLVLYPMHAQNRRRERRLDIFSLLSHEGWRLQQTTDLSLWENEQTYLEGTGSLVLARDVHVAYAALSERTHRNAVVHWSEKMNFKPIIFEAFDTVDGQKVPIYHTNVVMCVGSTWAIVCFDALSLADAKRVEKSLQEAGRCIIPISLMQMRNFAGNMLELEGNSGALVVMSETARLALDSHQLDELAKHGELLSIPIPTIEKIGGGSIRCMMAEIF
jgi:hypothetical protein